MTVLDFQDDISHRAAKPELMGQVLHGLLEFQDGISHPTAKPQLTQNQKLTFTAN